MRRRWTRRDWRKAVLILVACGLTISLLPFWLIVLHTSHLSEHLEYQRRASGQGTDGEAVGMGGQGDDAEADIEDIEKWLDDHAEQMERERQDASHAAAMQPVEIRARRVERPTYRAAGMKQGCAKKHATYRIAVLCPWVTNTHRFPPWFSPYFLSSLPRSSLLADFLIFHESLAMPALVPSNAKLVDVGVGGMAQLIATGIGSYLGWSERNTSLMHKYLRFLLHRWPRLVAEYKPAYGTVFKQWLGPYSHYAYADMDSAFGSLPGFIEAAELRDHDIVSYSFGDHGAIYLRGQWTMQRKSEKTEGLWAQCAHLAAGLLKELATKIRHVQAAEAKNITNYRKRFLSAEGCYSVRALSAEAGLSVKIANRQFVGLDSRSRSDIIVANGAVWQCRKGVVDMRALLAASKPDCNESLPGSHTAAGLAVPFEPLNSTACANWILAEHRVCANAAVVRPNMDIFVSNGSFAAQLVEPRPHTMLPNGCRQAAIFHFQEWKKGWNAATSFSPSSTLDISVFKISVDGIFRLS